MQLTEEQNKRVREAIMRAYVAGWADGRRKIPNDDKKVEIANSLLDWLSKGD
jgi:hypothetical protein